MEQFPNDTEESFENRTHRLFEEQFSNVEKIPFQDTIIDVVDLRPEHEKTDVPLLFVPGWGATPELSKEGLEVYYKSGRRVIAFSYPAEANPPQQKERQNQNLEKIPSVLAMKAASINTVLEAKGVSKVDVIAHSEGCMNVVLAAAEHEDKFRHFVLMAPPGLTGKENYLTILGNMIANVKSINAEKKKGVPEIGNRIKKMDMEAKKWVKGRGLIKGSLEGMAPGRFDVSELVRQLQTSNDGTAHGISIIAGVDDAMVSMDKFQTKTAAELGVDGFYSVIGGHLQPVFEPDKYSAAAESALEALENKYKKEE